jgi:glycine/D-amino acid oxidase-like deaminating enzyme
MGDKLMLQIFPRAVPPNARVLVAGGGLLGLSIAAVLSRRLPRGSILLVERRPNLLGETSSASTGGFRNFYPESPSMTALSNLSIDGLLRLDAAVKQAEAVSEGAQKEIKGALDRVEAAKKSAESGKTAANNIANTKAEQAHNDAHAAANDASAKAHDAAAHAGHGH